MVEAFVFLRGMALGLLVALAMGLALRFRRHYAARVLALLSVSLAAYALTPLLYARTGWFYPVGLLSDTIPMVFLLFVQALFEDQRRPSVVTLIVGGIYIALGYFGVWFPHVLPIDGLDISLPRLISRITMGAMLAYALLLTVRQWRQDLVEPRRRLRLAVTAIVGLYILGVVMVETVDARLPVPEWLELLHSAGIVVCVLLFMAAILWLGSEGLLAPDDSGPPRRPEMLEDPDLARVVAAMETERLYRDMDLNIRQLADSLGIREHRLRRLINGELGYRNFNDFLNHYRLQEVSQRLLAEDSRQLPILTIAMGAGYRSLTTFNRAFKALHGLTPREYRARH